MLIIAVLSILTFLTFSTACKKGLTGPFFKVGLINLSIFIFWSGTSLTQPKWFFPEEETTTESAQLIKLSLPATNRGAKIIYSEKEPPCYVDICYKREGAALHTDKSFLIRDKDIFISTVSKTEKATLSIVTKSKKARLGWWFFPSLPLSGETFHVALPEK